MTTLIYCTRQSESNMMPSARYFCRVHSEICIELACNLARHRRSEVARASV